MGLTTTEYFTFEDSEIMTVSLESSQPANTSITVILQLLPESASGIMHVLQLPLCSNQWRLQEWILRMMKL